MTQPTALTHHPLVEDEPSADSPSDIRDLGLRGTARTDPARLAALHETGLLDSEIEEVFDRLTRLAVRLLRVPASFISLVDADRDFYKSACGFGEPLATMRELTGPTFCHYTVERTTPLVIPDTAADPVYRDVPTVRTLGVAAYVGVPLIVGGQAVGALCTIDTRPRAWTDDEVEVLVELAASAQREMELRVAVAVARRATAAAEQGREELERLNHQLQESAIELEMQAEELKSTAAILEERTEAAEVANAAKSGFLSMMSHELRTPLNAIAGYAELLAMGVRGAVTSEQMEYLTRIQRAGRHLQLLISDILEHTHLNEGHLQFDIGDVRVADVIDEAAELLAPQFTEFAITFSRTSDRVAANAGPRLARADEKKLRQILINLLTNAIKFMSGAGSVSVTSETRDGCVLIRVADSGRGIPPDELTHIFEPFVQLDRGSSSTREQGVGLGLSISRQLARGMHGDLSVVSEVGVGSVFTVALPAA